MSKDEVATPWVTYPGYSPGDSFWRQSGEAWFNFVWRPYWNSLSPLEQENYLKRWEVPDVWRIFYFNSDFQQWLASTDEF